MTKIDYSAGFRITDVDSHDRGTSCFTEHSSVESCECEDPDWYTQEEAESAPKEVQSRLVMRPNRRYPPAL